MQYATILFQWNKSQAEPLDTSTYDYMRLSNEENVVRGYTQWVMVVMRGGVGLGWGGGKFSLFASLYWLNCFTGHNKHILLWLFQNINRERKTNDGFLSPSIFILSWTSGRECSPPPHTPPHSTSCVCRHLSPICRGTCYLPQKSQVVVQFRECVWVSMRLFENSGPLKDLASPENTEELRMGPTTVQIDISKSQRWPGQFFQ